MVHPQQYPGRRVASWGNRGHCERARLHVPDGRVLCVDNKLARHSRLAIPCYLFKRHFKLVKIGVQPTSERDSIVRLVDCTPIDQWEDPGVEDVEERQGGPLGVGL